MIALAAARQNQLFQAPLAVAFFPVLPEAIKLVIEDARGNRNVVDNQIASLDFIRSLKNLDSVSGRGRCMDNIFIDHLWRLREHEVSTCMG